MNVSLSNSHTKVALSKSNFDNNDESVLVPNQKNYALEILLDQIQLNPLLSLKNRCVMAPMTRCFADEGMPTESMAEYYGRRSGFGLIISEATMINQDAGYPGTPGIFSELHIPKWKLICDKVHEHGGKFFMQLWHTGMMSNAIYRGGKQPIAASDVFQNDGFIPRTNQTVKFQAPKPMDKQEMEEIKKAFFESASNAISADCDGIELHAGSGFLLDSFLHYYTNKRTDEYGGKPENMCSFLLELIDELIPKIGAERIGIRLSPVPIPAMNNMQEDKRDVEVFIYLLKELKNRNIAYVHVGADDDVKNNGNFGMPISHFLKKYFEGIVIGCGSYSLEDGAKALEQEKFDLLAIGRLAIANPNLVELIKNKDQSSILSFDVTMLNQLI